MPINGEFLGFRSTWYAGAVKFAEVRSLTPEISIRVVTPPYFFATKLEAFNDRGRNDFLGSHDLEDLVAVVNGREELSDEVQNSSKNVRKFIADSVRRLMADRRFIDSLPGHLMPEADRTTIVLRRLQKLANAG